MNKGAVIPVGPHGPQHTNKTPEYDFGDKVRVHNHLCHSSKLHSDEEHTIVGIREVMSNGIFDRFTYKLSGIDPMWMYDAHKIYLVEATKTEAVDNFDRAMSIL
jgi:hypothetical protein